VCSCFQDGVFLLPGCCDPFNEKAVRASRGACFRVSIATGHWDLLQQFVDAHQMKLYAAEPEHQVAFPTTSNNAINSVNASSGAAMYPTEIEMTAVASGPNCLATAGAEDALCLVLGNEGQGLSDIAQRACNRVSIPMPGLFESLNVAVAGGILLYLLKHDLPPPSSWSKLL
jgi:TrmH family RNA methyltransferase